MLNSNETIFTIKNLFAVVWLNIVTILLLTKQQAPYNLLIIRGLISYSILLNVPEAGTIPTKKGKNMQLHTTVY